MAEPKRGVAFTFTLAVTDSANRPQLKVNPTLATGDFKVSKDGGALANLTTLPSVSPASSRLIAVALSATEMTADRVDVQAVDAAGAEWDETLISIITTVSVIDDLAGTATGEPAQGTPGVSVTRAEKIDYLYKAWRNKSTQSATTYSLFADNTTTVDQKSTVSDDGSTYTRGEVATGP